MNPWIVFGVLVNVVMGFLLFQVDSFQLFKGTLGFEPLMMLLLSQISATDLTGAVSALGGYAKQFPKHEAMMWLRVAMGVWYVFVLASVVGVIMIALGRKKGGAWLIFISGFVSLPIGLLQARGAWLMLDQMREEELVEQWGFTPANPSLDSTLSRKWWMASFDLGFGLLLSLSALGLTLYSNYHFFHRRFAMPLLETIRLQEHADSLTMPFLILGIACLFSLLIFGAVLLAMSSLTTFAIAWKAMSFALLPGPTLVLAFALGVALFILGLGSLQRPLIQLRENYFSLRPGLFSKRIYSLYKDIQDIEVVDEKKVLLHLPVSGKERTLALPLKAADERKRRHLLNIFAQRREKQARLLLV